MDKNCIKKKSMFRQQNHLGESCQILNDAEKRTHLKFENIASYALWSLNYLNKNEISLGEK